MFNKAALLTSGKEKVSTSTTGEFTLKSGYQYWDPYQDGVTDIEQFWGYGVGGDDPYVHVSFGSVTPEPVCLLGQTMYSFGWANNYGSGWDGLRLWFGNSDEVSWPEQVLLICHTIGQYCVENHVAEGLYGSYDYGALSYPEALRDVLVASDSESVWEIRAISDNPVLDTFPVYVNISEAKGVQHPMAVLASVYNWDESYYNEVEFTTDANGYGTINLSGIHSFSDLPGSWSIYVRASSYPEQMSEPVFDSFPFDKSRPLELWLRDND